MMREVGFDHEAQPSSDAIAGAVFTTCADPSCSVPVWREDDGTVWQHVNVGEDEE